MYVTLNKGSLALRPPTLQQPRKGGREPALFYDFSTVVVIGFTCPAMTVVTCELDIRPVIVDGRL